MLRSTPESPILASMDPVETRRSQRVTKKPQRTTFLPIAAIPDWARFPVARGTLTAMPLDDEKHVRSVSISRVVSLASSFAFAILAVTLAAVGRIDPIEAAWAVASIAVIFVPTGWWAPVGWRRRAAEAVLVFPAWALILLADPVQRMMVLPPLLALAAWASLVAAWPRIPVTRRVLSVVLLAVSVRAATGTGLVGYEWWRIVLTFGACAALAWAATRLGGRDLGISVALLAAVAPFQSSPPAAGVVLLMALIVGPFGNPKGEKEGGLGWVPGLVGAALFGTTLAAWGGLGVDWIFPEMGGIAIGALVGAVVLTRILPPGLAGVVWLIAAMAVGPALAPTPDRRGFVLGGELADVDLPAGTGAPYVLDIRLDGPRDIPPGAAVAWFRVGDRTHRVVHPDQAIHRSGEGAPSSGTVWRPEAVGSDGNWRAAVRSVYVVPAGVVPHLTRHPDLAEEFTVVLETEGAALPTPPRDRTMGWWMIAAAVAVTAIQLGSGAWRLAIAVLPWTILVSGTLIARASVEPLRLLGERFGPDLALAALLAAWVPAAVIWLRHRRIALAVAALLLPLAAAAPHLTPALYGDEPFHLAVMESVLGDGDIDLGNNVDIEAHPQEAVFDQNGDLLHSPALGALLLPGFAVAGRTGALLLLALMGAAAVALVARRARRLGVPEARLRGLALVLAATYPVAIFATQIWVELLGALAVAAILLAAAGSRNGRWVAVAWALLATVVKTRLGLLVFPPALAALWGHRRGRVFGLLSLLGVAAASAAVGFVTMGHPFGIYRRLHHLVPSDPAMAARVVGGLAFDPAGGLLFSAPLWLVALTGVVALWRRGGPGERTLLLGCGLTVAALLHSLEWYGGGSPPARYLVPMLPAVALAGGMILRQPKRWRAAAEVLLLPSLAVWWVLVTRPHLSLNPGDGGWWAADALARSYLVDTAWLLPSFLVTRTATWVVPLVVLVVVLLVWTATRWKPLVARRVAAAGTAVWLLGAAGLVAAIELRTDRVVEAESPQVRRHGGEPHPAEGTFSRFTHRRGWMLRDGQAVTVPLHLPAGASVWIEGWLLGTAQRGAEVEVRWDGEDPVLLRVQGDDPDARLLLPGVPDQGRHTLRITMWAQPHGAVVLDRVVVESNP